MSISQAHSDAARLNGHASQGPVTESGKAISSQNARKHSLFAAIILLPNEDREAFETLLNAYLGEHQPQTPTEVRCVREMADADFRLCRTRNYAIEIQLKAMTKFPDSEQPESDAFQDLAENGTSLQLLMRYERMFQRQFDSALRTLLDLRKRAKAQEPPPPPEPSPVDKTLNARLVVLETLILGYSNSPYAGNLERELAGDDEDFEEFEEDTPSQPDLQNEPSKPPARG